MDEYFSECESVEHYLLERVPVIFDRAKQFASAVVVEALGILIIGLNPRG